MISVIIPVYNAQPYLARCIDSVRNSPCSSLEILLVNDGSTDDSPRLCSRYAAEDRRIRFITQQNQGVSAARNRGIREARGEWIVFLDADDFISPDFLPLVEKEAYQEQDLLLFHFAQHVSGAPSADTQTPCRNTENTAAKAYCWQGDEMLRLIERILVPSPLVAGCCADFRTPCGRAYRKSILDRYTIRFSPDIRIGEDLLFNLEYQLKADSCTYIPRTVYFYDIHGDSSSHRFYPELHDNHIRLLEAVRNTLEQSRRFSPLRKAYYSYALENLTYVLIREVFSPLSPRTYRENRRICRKMRRNSLYREAMPCNPTTGILPRKILVAVFRFGCYPMTALISRISYTYLQRR